MFGATAVELVAAGDFGKRVAFTGLGVKGVKISEAVGRLKTVPPEGHLARTARALGISLGDQPYASVRIVRPMLWSPL